MARENKNISPVMAIGVWILVFALSSYLLSYKFNDDDVNPNKHIHVDNFKSSATERSITLKLNKYSQYVLSGKINNHRVDFILDTGATHVAIPQRIAKQAGLKPGTKYEVSTANGDIYAYLSKIDKLQFGNITLSNVNAMIMPDNEDDEGYILLGMSALKKLEFTHTNGKLRITQYKK